MVTVPSPIITSAGLIGGYVVARETKRAFGGAVLVAAGGVAFEMWRRQAGLATAGALTGGYLAAFGVSHPLAKKIGAWPSVLTVAAATGIAGYALGDRRACGPYGACSHDRRIPPRGDGTVLVITRAIVAEALETEAMPGTR